MPRQEHHSVIQQLIITFNMKLIVLTTLLGLAVADRLENTYLPPSSARTAGGSGSFLSAPHGSSFGRSGSFGSSSFGRSSFGSTGIGAHGAPSTSYGAPSASYGAPGAGARFGGGFGGQQIPILRLNSDNDGLGSYRYEYETGNGISAHEGGQAANSVQGSYSYTGDDGRQYTVHYTADENGFHPQGDHLPTPPPIPEAILRSLQYNAQHGSSDSGRYDSSLDGVSVEAASRQYLAPRQSSFNRNSGYRY